MAHNWVRPPPPLPQDLHHGSSAAVTTLGAPLRYPPTTLRDLIYFSNLQPPPFYEPHPFFIPYIHHMPCLPAPSHAMMRAHAPGNATPLYYQWHDVPSTQGSPPTRSLVPVYLHRNDRGASARQRQARLVQAMSQPPTSFLASQGHGDGSFQENVIARHSSVSQPPWNEVASWMSQERWNELGLPSGYNRQQAGYEASSRVNQEPWNDIRLPQGHIRHQQVWNEFSSCISQERWNELGLSSGYSHQQEVNETSSRVSEERRNEISLPPGYNRQQAGNGGSSRTSQERCNAPVVPPGFNQEERSEVRPETYAQRGAIPKNRPSQQIVGREEFSQRSIISHTLSQQGEAREGQTEAAFQGIPMPEHRSGQRERQESIGQSRKPQVESVETTNIWPLLPQEKEKVRNFNCKTSSSIFLRNASDIDVDAFTYLSTQVEMSLKTYASAIMSLSAPSGTPTLDTPVMEDAAACNAKVLQDPNTNKTFGATDDPKVLQDVNTKKTLGATDGPNVLQDPNTKKTLGATDDPKDVASGSDNKFPLEPDSFFYTADMDVLMNYVSNVRPTSRMKYTESFVRPKKASAYSPVNIYDTNPPEDLPKEPPMSDMYVLEQRLKNGKAAVKLCKDLGIDDEVLEKYGEEDGYSIYRVCHYPQFHPLWLESHPPGKSPVPCQADIDEAFAHLGPNRKPGDLLNEFVDKLMDYNTKTRDQTNPSSKEQQYKSDPTINEGVKKGKKSRVGRERKDKK